ncbi:LytR/AlgR family response regulator transcription factor [Clostridium sp. DL1XJH146]
MKIALCDDNNQDLLHIRQFIYEFLSCNFTEIKIEVHSFKSSLELIHQLESGKCFDIFLLDIIIPGITGMELATYIRSKDPVGKIIFLTSSPEFAIESYSVSAFDYLLKPVQKDKLYSVLGKAIKDIYSETKKYIIVKTQIGMVKIFMHDLIYIDVIKRTIFFHQTNGVVIESITTLSKVEIVLLTDKRFIKPHRSYIVNLDYIKSLSKNGLTMTNNQLIPISRNVFKAVKQAYINYYFQ